MHNPSHEGHQHGKKLSSARFVCTIAENVDLAMAQMTPPRSVSLYSPAAF